MTTDESLSNDKIHSLKLVYSLGVSFVGIGFIIGIANFVSTRYISVNMQLGLRLLFFFLLAGSLGLLFNILMHGFSLIEDFRKINSQIIYISGKFFDAGMTSVFIGLFIYLPFFVFIVKMPISVRFSPAGIILAWAFLLFWNFLIIGILFDLKFLSLIRKTSELKIHNLKFSAFRITCRVTVNTISFLTLILAFLLSNFNPKIHKSLNSKYIPYLKKQTTEIAPFGIMLFIILSSALLSDLITFNSYTIIIDKELYEKNRDQILMVTIKVGGFASVDDLEKIGFWIYSDKWEKKTLTRENQGYEKGYYRVFVIVTNFEEGVHYIEVASSASEETFRKREEFFINKAPENSETK